MAMTRPPSVIGFPSAMVCRAVLTSWLSWVAHLFNQHWSNSPGWSCFPIGPRIHGPRPEVRPSPVSRAVVKTAETAETSTASAEALGKIVLWIGSNWFKVFLLKPWLLPPNMASWETSLAVSGRFHYVSLLGRRTLIDSTAFKVRFLSDKMNQTHIIWDNGVQFSNPKFFLNVFDVSKWVWQTLKWLTGGFLYVQSSRTIPTYALLPRLGKTNPQKYGDRSRPIIPYFHIFSIFQY